jgi:hypothetical protein
MRYGKTNNDAAYSCPRIHNATHHIPLMIDEQPIAALSKRAQTAGEAIFKVR